MARYTCRTSCRRRAGAKTREQQRSVTWHEPPELGAALEPQSGLYADRQLPSGVPGTSAGWGSQPSPAVTGITSLTVLYAIWATTLAPCGPWTECAASPMLEYQVKSPWNAGAATSARWTEPSHGQIPQVISDQF